MNYKRLTLFSILLLLVLLIGSAAIAAVDTGFSVVADFESGIPAGFVRFSDALDGTGSSTTVDLSTDNVELPTVPVTTGNTVVTLDYDIAATGGWGGGPGYGGVTHDFAATQDWSAYDAFTLWFYSSGSGAQLQVELKSDGGDAFNSNRYQYTFTDDVPGWRFFTLPWDAFTRRFDFNPGPSPDDPINLGAMWGYSILLPGGAAGTFYLDQVAVTTSAVVADFEAGIPAGFVRFSDALDGTGSSTTVDLSTGNVELPTVPAVAGNTVISVTYDIAASGGWGGGPGYGGITHDFPATEDWSASEAFSFWFHGSNSGAVMRIELKSDGADAFNSNRYEYTFADDNAGWRFFNLGWDDFTRRTDFNPGPSPDDPINLGAMWGYSILLPGGAAGNFYFDHVVLNGVVAEEPYLLVDDFESGLPVGVDGNDIPIGFFTALGGGTMELSTESTPPAPPLPAAGEAAQAQAAVDEPNNVFKVDVDTGSWAVAIHGFENEAVDTWVSQDWSAYEGFAFWLHGTGSGIGLFIDLIENRNPGSDIDDAERWSIGFEDDFAGWRYVKIPFTDFTRKEIGNGAPNDGLTLDEVHGWAFGTLNTDGPKTFYLDNVAAYGVAPERPLQVNFASANFEAEEGALASIAVKLTRPLKEDDPDEVSIAFTTDGGSAIVDRDYTPTSGRLTFVKGGASELSFTIQTFDNNKHDGDKRVILRLSDPTDVELGFAAQSSLTILDNDPLDTLLLDDFERYPYLWHTAGDISLDQIEIANDDPRAVPGQGAFEGVLGVTAPLDVEIDIMPGGDGGRLCNSGKGVVPVAILTTDTFDATTVDHTTVRFGEVGEAHSNHRTGRITRHEEDVDKDGDIDLMFHFSYAATGFDCDGTGAYLTGSTFDGQAISSGVVYNFGRDFAQGQDWSFSEGLNFWYYGAGNGDTVTVQLKDNRAPDPGPDGWSLVWSDEFNDPVGTSPNPANWGYEIGDGTINGIPGWGNDERQYYTDSTDNVATDGDGNLVITAREANGDYLCYYGPCEYTSARLVSKHKAEFAYGRIESRMLVPDGEDGLWPAFWSLGTDIDEVDWPQTGEIDIMEYVSRIPDEIFGTIHGPGYSGGQSYGDTYPFPGGVSTDYHTFAIEWQPDLIEWYVDDILYHTATPDDVAPNEWVFNDPVYLLLNMAIGGNFGGQVSDDLVFPQELTVDYVRVYQGPDTGERFEASFVDDVMGWRKVEVPFSAFTRSADQPAGAPDDGLGLNEVWGYGFQLNGGAANGPIMLDQVRLDAPLALTVTNDNDSGPGSLRQAIAAVATGGDITFDPSLAGDSITLSSGPLVISKDVVIDASDAPGLTVSGNGVHRVFIVDPSASVHLGHLIIANGYGWQLAGGVLNNGQLILDHVTVSDNEMATDAGDFWQGGGGIYNGADSSLLLVDSTVSGNTSGWAGGGIYSFFGSTATIVRSTISGNTAGDVGGGLRSLGNATITNSTISGNTATAWHGGGAFITDGVVTIVNSTVTANSAPGGTAGGLFVGTFTDASATLNLQNTIVAANGDFGCVIVYGAGAVALNSLGNNVFTDATCSPVGTDLVVGDALLGALADNGGPTFTHALLATSPAVDAANAAACPAVDQRGVARPQGAGCDVGAFELVQ